MPNCARGCTKWPAADSGVALAAVHPRRQQRDTFGATGRGENALERGAAEEAIRSGLGAYFITAHLGRAYREGRLDRRMRVYLAPKVLVIDEVGYLPLDDLGATIFFQLVSARYERGSIILTSNKSFGDWGSIFSDSIIATAILDRLLHHSTTTF